MAYPPQKFYTPEEYLTFERASGTKHEYLNGNILAIRRVNAQHVLIVTNLVGELGLRLKAGPCILYSAALRVRTAPTGLYTYPDVIVLCDEPRFSDEQEDTLLNPALILKFFLNRRRTTTAAESSSSIARLTPSSSIC